jgi:hypothetical protein
LQQGKVGTAALEEFYAAGYTKENVVDLVMAIGLLLYQRFIMLLMWQLTFQ